MYLYCYMYMYMYVRCHIPLAVLVYCGLGQYFARREPASQFVNKCDCRK